jgi:hypothetical protein
MEESRPIKDFHPYRIGEDSDVTQETEIIQSDSMSESEIDYMDSDEEDLDFNVIEIDDMVLLYGPPNDIIDDFEDLSLLEDIDVEELDLFETETKAIDEVTFVYGPPPEIIRSHKDWEITEQGQRWLRYIWSKNKK